MLLENNLDRSKRSSTRLLVLSSALVFACSSSPSGAVIQSGAGAGGAAGSAGGPLLGGSGGLAGGGSGGTAAAPGACPDLHTPPANCPTKILPIPTQGFPELIVRTQADVDALAGYTEIDSALTILSDSSEDLTNLDALHCLQSVPMGLTLSAQNLTSLDGLRELTQCGPLKIDRNPLAIEGCGLRKLSQVSTLQVTYEPKITRLAFALLDASTVDIDIDNDAALESVELSPAITSLNELFIDANPLLTSVSGLAGLRTVTHWLDISGNPMLPLCQAQAIQNQLSQPPQMVTIDGDPSGTCP